VQAAQCLREGRPREAAGYFERMSQLRPDHADTWFNLGYSRRATRQYEAALDAYGEALARGVSSPEDVHINRSVILSEFLHRMPDAADELRKAVAANPHAVRAWINLGGLYDDLGDGPAARDAYQHALEADPRNGQALARLAAIDVHEGQQDRAISRLESSLRESASDEDGAEILFALGNALDAAGRYADAFRAITEANRVAAGIRRQGFRYDRKAQEELIDALIALPETATAGPFPADRPPIFICGMFRSGSTLIEQFLARHRGVTAGGELEFIPAIVHEDLSPYPRMLAQASADRLHSLRQEYLDQLHRLVPREQRATDKRPDNFVHIGLIKALFPEARIVHTVRHALDNILSVFFLYFGDAVRYSEQLADIVHYYAQYRRLMDHWRGRFGADIHDVDYDVLVSDPKSALEPLLAFCGLEWDEACLDHQPASAVRTASNWQVRKPLHTKSSARWKNYERELEGVRQSLTAAGLL
jgi:tetratricopeptide (TPR) repeat protein